MTETTQEHALDHAATAPADVNSSATIVAAPSITEAPAPPQATRRFRSLRLRFRWNISSTIQAATVSTASTQAGTS